MLIACMKCKRKQNAVNIEYEVVQCTRAFRAKGLCSVCHGKVGEFISEDKVPSIDMIKLKPGKIKVETELVATLEDCVLQISELQISQVPD